MKSVVFDSGPIISLTMNNLLWLLEPMKKRFGGEFYITKDVKFELVDKPMNIKRFEFEAMQIQGDIDCGVIGVADDLDVDALSGSLIRLANSCFSAKGHDISIVSSGEMSTLALAIKLCSETVVVDERTTRDLIEKPENIARHMQERLHTKVSVNYDSLSSLKKQIKGIKVIRSVEIVAVAFELGLIDRYIDRCKNPSPELRRRLLDSVLWGVKLDGCAVSENEISEMMKMILD